MYKGMNEHLYLHACEIRANNQPNPFFKDDAEKLSMTHLQARFFATKVD